MIQRLVLLKLKDQYAHESVRNELAAKSRAVLPNIPGVTGVTVGVPGDDATEIAWDLSLSVEFASLEDVAPYISHPSHRLYVDETLKPKVEILKAWNFDIA